MQIVMVLHNLIRWAVVVFGLWTLLSAISGVISKRNYTSPDRRGSFFFVLSCDLQLVLGLILYFANSWFDRLKHLGDNMKDANSRFFTMEHALMMISPVTTIAEMNSELRALATAAGLEFDCGAGGRIDAAIAIVAEAPGDRECSLKQPLIACFYQLQLNQHLCFRIFSLRYLDKINSWL